MKAFVRVFIILCVTGATALNAVPALAGVSLSDEALCVSDCVEEFGRCKGDCGIECDDGVCVAECRAVCHDEVIACVGTCSPGECGDGTVDPGEQCEPEVLDCPFPRVCNQSCICEPELGR